MRYWESPFVNFDRDADYHFGSREVHFKGGYESVMAPDLLFIAIAAAGVAAVSPPARAQARSAAAEVKLAAVRYLRASSSRAAAVSVDPVPLGKEHSAALAPARDPTRTAALAGILGGPAARLSEIMQCPDGTRSCRLIGVVAHVAVSEPVIEGDSATIDVARWFEVTGARTPVAYSRFELRLLREGVTWRVLRMRGTVAS